LNFLQPQESQKWVSALREAIMGATANVDKPRTASVAGPTSAPTSKAGWLVKKGKSRWFVVINEVLLWYTQQQVTLPYKGELGVLTRF
jgi:hypothetical protein